MRITFEIDDIEAQDFINDVVLNVDIFRSIGYWARGEGKDRTWKLFDENDALIGVLNRKLAKKVIIELYIIGSSIYDYDSNDLDNAVQKALFGKVVYG